MTRLSIQLDFWGVLIMSMLIKNEVLSWVLTALAFVLIALRVYIVKEGVK